MAGAPSRYHSLTCIRTLLGAALSLLLTGSLLGAPPVPASADTVSAAPIATAPVADGTIVRDGVGYLAGTDGKTRTATVTAFDPGVGGNGATIPRTITGFGHEYTVTAIGERAFMATGLVGIRLPETIAEIGPDAFSDNPGLKSVSVGGLIPSIEPAASAHHSFDPSVVIAYPATLDSEIIGRSGFSHPRWQGYDSRYTLPVPARSHITVDRDASGSSRTVTVEVTPQISGVVASGTVELTVPHSTGKKKSGHPKSSTDTIRLVLDVRGIARTRVTLLRGSGTVEITADYLGDGTVEATTTTARMALTGPPASRDHSDESRVPSAL